MVAMEEEKGCWSPNTSQAFFLIAPAKKLQLRWKEPDICAAIWTEGAHTIIYSSKPTLQAGGPDILMLRLNSIIWWQSDITKDTRNQE